MKNNAKTGITELPAWIHGVAEESDHAVFHVADGATLRFTNDFTVGDVWLDTANATLDLGSNTLTINTREHSLTPGTVINYGAIVWRGIAPGSLIIVK